MLKKNAKIKLYVDSCSMSSQELNGRNIRVSYANERPSGPRSFNNNFGGEGNFGRGGDY